MKHILFLAALVFTLNCFGQSWLHGRTGSTPYVAVKMDSLENSVAYSGTSNVLGYKSVLSKYDKSNNRLWTHNITHRPITPPYVGFLSHAIDGDGNIYVISTPMASFNGIPYPSDTALLFIKFGPNGDLKWIKNISFVSYAVKLVSDNANNLYVCGQTDKPYIRIADSLYGPVPSTTTVFLSRLDTSGKVKWTRFLSAQLRVPYTSGGSNTYPNRIEPNISTNRSGDVVLTGTYIDTINVAGVRHTASAVNSTMKRASLVVLFDQAGSVVYRKHVPNYYPAEAMRFNLLFDDRRMVYVAKSYDTTITHPTYGGAYYVDSVNILNPAGDRVRAFNLKFNDTTVFDVSGITRKDTGSQFFLSGSYNQSFLPGPSSDRYRFQTRAYDSTGMLQWTRSLPYLALPHNSYLLGLAVRRNIFSTVGYLNMQTTGTLVMGVDTLNLSPNNNYGNNPIFGLFSDHGNMVSGRAYYDANSNNQFDPDEMPATYLQIRNGQQQIIFTDAEGRYSYVTGAGNYTDSVRTPLYHISTPPHYSYSFTGLDSSVINRDFRLTPVASITDMSVSLIPRSIATFSTPSWLQINYKNAGTDTVNAVVKLRLSPLGTYISSTKPTSYVSTDSVGWQLNGLVPGATGYIMVKVNYATAPLNTPVRSIVNITPVSNDSNKLNNVDTLNQLLRGSWDPNNKLGNPVDTLNKANVTAGTEWIEYVINFQNTGTDTARFVRIMDTLSSLLDHASVDILGATHKMVAKLEGNRLVFEFAGINLPDSNVDRSGSMGAVYFRIRTRSNLTVADTVRNKAAIYFDFNNAVVTNATSNYLKQNIVTSIPVTNIGNRELYVFPNPVVTQNEVQFKAEGLVAGTYLVRILDMNGRFVYTGTLKLNSPIQKLSGIHLPRGVYMLELSNPAVRRSAIFLKMQ